MAMIEIILLFLLVTPTYLFTLNDLFNHSIHGKIWSLAWFVTGVDIGMILHFVGIIFSVILSQR